MTHTPQAQDVWEFPGAMTGPDTHVISGDVLRVRLDLGFHTDRVAVVCLDGVDTADYYDADTADDTDAQGVAHYRFVVQWLDAAATRYDGDWPLVVTTAPQEPGAFGRWVADVRRVHDDADLRADLVDAFGTAVQPD